MASTVLVHAIAAITRASNFLAARDFAFTQLYGAMRKSRQRRCIAAISTAAAANTPKLLDGCRNPG
jgi:hypothetical protein